jgi:hypothetical protein
MTGRAWFTWALLPPVVLLLVLSFGLAPASRLAPLWVLVPTTVLLLVQLLMDSSPRVRERLRVLQGATVDVPVSETRAAEPEPAPATVYPGSRRGREVRVVFWLALLIGLIYAVGFVLSTALFLLAYLRKESGLGWGRAVTLAAVATAVVYLVFGVVARVPFPPGVLF